MSASGQQAEDQVAQMREALRSVARSRRKSRLVGIVALVVGFGIVGLFLWSFFSIMRAVGENTDPLRDAFTQRIQLLGLERKASEIAKAVAPVVQKETMALLKDLELPKLAMEEARTMASDLRPVVQAEFNRVRPRLEKLLEEQKEKTAEGLRALLEDKLSGRFVASIETYSQDLETGTGLTKEKLAQVIENLQTACGEALANVIQKRTGDVRTEMEKIGLMLEQIPPLPKEDELSQDELLAQMKDVLLALLKENLPDYPIAAHEFRRTQADERAARAAAEERAARAAGEGGQ